MGAFKRISARAGFDAATEANLWKMPERRTKGCLTFSAKPHLAACGFAPAWSDRLNLPLFWANGERCILEIASLFTAETGGTSEDAVAGNLKWLLPYFELLRREGYIEYV
jgi:hypothetical protein